jgi:catechol 1,2-dioxygenase
MKNHPLFDAASRREFLRVVGIGTVTVPLLGFLGCGSDAESGDSEPTNEGDPACALTNTDPYGLGPFYLAGAPNRPDLVPVGAAGKPLHLSGRVLAADCLTPLPNAEVEVWQADADGAYDMSSPEFWYRARLIADAQGSYAFRTIYPGAYPFNAQRFRPAHIHYRVRYNDTVLVTQLYFEGDPHLAGDPGDEPSRTIALNVVEGVKIGVFDIVLDV